MSSRTVYVCDRCGTQKLESNHWFGTRITESEAGETYLPTLSIFSFSDTPTLPDAKHICGESCLQKEVAAFAVDLTLKAGEQDKLASRAITKAYAGSIESRDCGGLRCQQAGCLDCFPPVTPPMPAHLADRCLCGGVGCNSCEPRGNYQY